MRLSTIGAALVVTLTFSSPPTPAPCPPVAPQVVQNADGSYSRINPSQVNPVACFEPGQTWEELWTDTPENGGQPVQVQGPAPSDSPMLARPVPIATPVPALGTAPQ